MLTDYTGEVAALGAAFVWALAAVVFHRIGAAIPPLALNLCKGLLTIVMLLMTLAVRSELNASISLYALGLLVVSGGIGIGVGDTAFFAALNRLGERRTVLMAETLAPPIATLIAFFALSEILPPLALVGVAITVAGVAWVIVEQTPQAKADAPRLNAGVAYGLVAAFCQATGAVLSRAALTQTDVTPLWSALIRIGSGVAILLIWIPIAGQGYVPRSLRTPRLWPAILLATVLGTFVGISLQQMSLQHTHAGVTQTLIATSALFILPLVALRGERVSLRAGVGALVAVGGIALLFLAG